MSNEVEVNNGFLYDFSLRMKNFASYLQSKTSKDFLTSFSNCHLNILMFSILQFQMYINCLKGEYKIIS